MRTFKISFAFLILFFLAVDLQAQTPASGGEKTYAVPLSADGVDPLKKGSRIPDLSLTTPEGELFDLNAYVKDQPVVLVFYRGGWCPYCNAHLQELMEADPKLRSLGYEILALSPDKPEKLAESFEEHELTYKLLSDSEMKAAKAFGVAFKVEDSTVKKYKEYGINLGVASGENHPLLPVPSVFIVDKKGIIRYVYSNPDYKVRLKSEELVQQAQEAL